MKGVLGAWFLDMNEKEPISPEEHERDFKHRIGFKYAVGQTEIMRQALRGNGGKPVAIFYNRGSNREILILDQEFLAAMAGGTAGFYTELKQFGLRDYAESVVAQIFKDDEDQVA